MERFAITRRLDALVAARDVSGYTVEEDTSYLAAEWPTLTYRMYAGGQTANHNLGEFVAVAAALGAAIQVSRLVGTVVNPLAPGRVARSRQLCVNARFANSDRLQHCVGVVTERFQATAASSTPGSWRYPDLRVTGLAAVPAGMLAAFVHCWPAAGASPSLIGLSPQAPLPECVTGPVSVLECWLDLLLGAKLTQEIA